MGPPRRPLGFRPLRRTVWDDWGVRAVRGAGVSLAAASGSFARCDGRVFRPLRRAGISPRARGDRGFAPGPQNFFEKKFSKSFLFSQKGEVP